MIARRLVYAGIVAGALAVAPVLAQGQKAAPKKPANATAECNDGTFSTAKTQSGACSKHGGVKTWFGTAADTKADAKADAKSKASAADSKTKDAARNDAGKKESTKAGASAKNAGTPPAGATGQCTDGSYTRAKSQQGACSNHGGVKTWFADAGAAGSSSMPPASKTAPPAQVMPPPQSAPAAPQPAPAAAPATKQPAAAKPSSGAATPKSSGKAQIVAPPAGTPDNATAKCKDGTYSFAKQHSGACSNHGGVSEWYK